MPKAKVFVSGCYDLLHSGHVEFFRQAAEYGDLYVGIGSDKTIEGYKHHKTVYSEQERLFLILMLVVAYWISCRHWTLLSLISWW